MELKWTAQAVQTLGPDDADNIIDTGQMSACTCVVVFHGWSAGRFQHVRGWHGWGGVGAIKLDQLMTGVPAAKETLIYVIPGNDYKSSDYGLKLEYSTFDKNLPAEYSICTIFKHPAVSSARLHRDRSVPSSAPSHSVSEASLPSGAFFTPDAGSTGVIKTAEPLAAFFTKS